MKNPVLRIRKGTPVYDDSAEQEAPPARATAVPGRSRGRPAPRAGRLVLLPLFALALALIVLFRVLPGQGNRAVIGGWNTTLRATAYQDSLLVALTFVKEDRGGAATAGEKPLVEARIVLPDTGQEISLSGVLSKSPTTLRGQMDYSARVRQVRAEVTVGKDRRTLRLSARAKPR